MALQIPALIALGVGAKVAARVAPKLYDKYKKLKTKAKAAKTRNDKKKVVDEANEIAKKIKDESLKQAKLKSKRMGQQVKKEAPPGYGTKVLKGTGTALKGTGKVLGATASGARTGLSRGTGYFGRSGDPRRRFRKYVSSPIGIGYAGSEKSDPLLKELGGDKIVDFKKKMKSFKTGGKITYKVDNQGQDFVKKMYGGKVKK
mgnify:FL=1